MTLVRVSDLVGRDVLGMRADVRTRFADGSLTYPSTSQEARERTLKRVYMHTEKLCPTLRSMYGKDRGQWLRLEWQPGTEGIVGTVDCGFSGMLAESGEYQEWHIMIEEK